MDSSVQWADGLINWATPSPQGRPMSQSDFRSWTRTLKLVCLFVSYGLGMIAMHVNASMHPGGACMQNWVESIFCRKCYLAV